MKCVHHCSRQYYGCIELHSEVEDVQEHDALFDKCRCPLSECCRREKSEQKEEQGREGRRGHMYFYSKPGPVVTNYSPESDINLFTRVEPLT